MTSSHSVAYLLKSVVTPLTLLAEKRKFSDSASLSTIFSGLSPNVAYLKQYRLKKAKFCNSNPAPNLLFKMYLAVAFLVYTNTVDPKPILQKKQNYVNGDAHCPQNSVKP